MPTYDYECHGCGRSMEIFQRMSDDPLKKCPECGEEKLERKIGAGAGIIFKGSGFYETDYKRKESGGGGKSSTSYKSGSKSSDAKKDSSSSGGSKKSDAKSGD